MCWPTVPLPDLRRRRRRHPRVPGTDVDTSVPGACVVRELGRIAELRGRPWMIVSDNGAELTSNSVLAWFEKTGIKWHYIAPGKPMQNAPFKKFHRPAQERVPSVVGTWASRALPILSQLGSGFCPQSDLSAA